MVHNKKLLKLTLNELCFRDAADNIDLYFIVTEFEQYYELKYNRPPKLTRKLGPDGPGKQFFNFKGEIPNYQMFRKEK